MPGQMFKVEVGRSSSNFDKQLLYQNCSIAGKLK